VLESDRRGGRLRGAASERQKATEAFSLANMMRFVSNTFRCASFIERWIRGRGGGISGLRDVVPILCMR
jgi:hypothetical protein